MVLRLTVTRTEVDTFLIQMKKILTAEDFDINQDFVFQEVREKDKIDDVFTNRNTLLELDYESADVLEELKTLTLSEYYESVPDTRKTELVYFHVFCKKIKEKDVYIKVRIKEKKSIIQNQMSPKKHFVFCISFHFARSPMQDFPYKA